MAAGLLKRAKGKIRSKSFVACKKLAQGTRHLLRPPPHKQTIFVASVQRSGTTMMMNVLNRSFDTEVIFEWESRAYRDCELLQPETIHSLIAASKASHVVFKPLCDLHDLTMLLQEFSPARAIWMLRDYRDVVNSHVELWTGMPENMRQMVRDRNGAGWRGRGMSERTHNLISKLYHPGLSNASACALFWYLRNVLFLEHRLADDPRVILVRYESLVTRPHEEFRRLFEFLEIPYAPRVAEGVFASSIKKRPPPDIDPPIVELCEQLSRRFDDLASPTRKVAV